MTVDTVADERRSIATLIDGLDANQLAVQSLCSGWDVKTVAAHLVSDFADGFWGFLASGVRHGGIDRGIDALACRRAGNSPAPDCRYCRPGSRERGINLLPLLLQGEVPPVDGAEK